MCPCLLGASGITSENSACASCSAGQLKLLCPCVQITNGTTGRRLLQSGGAVSVDSFLFSNNRTGSQQNFNNAVQNGQLGSALNSIGLFYWEGHRRRSRLERCSALSQLEGLRSTCIVALADCEVHVSWLLSWEILTLLQHATAVPLLTPFSSSRLCPDQPCLLPAADWQRGASLPERGPSAVQPSHRRTHSQQHRRHPQPCAEDCPASRLGGGLGSGHCAVLLLLPLRECKGTAFPCMALHLFSCDQGCTCSHSSVICNSLGGHALVLVLPETHWHLLSSTLDSPDSLHCHICCAGIWLLALSLCCVTSST